MTDSKRERTSAVAAEMSTPPPFEPPRSPRLPRFDRQQLAQLVSLAAAVVVAVLANVAVARHYTRWDFTANKRYTLSAATVQTLHDLPDTVQVWVLLGAADPLEQSVKQLLAAYQAETSKLDVRYVDPDRDAAALEDVRKRFKIETGRTEQGHVVADAIVVVARGDRSSSENRAARHWFLTTSDMVKVSGADDTHVTPQEEQALTGAIRNVLGGEKAKLCFTAGHGELSVQDASDQGVGVLRDVLEKDNFDVAVVDPGAPGVAEPLQGCAVAVVAGLRGAFTKDEAERLRSYLLGGGNLLLAASPIAADVRESGTGMAPAGLERALAPFGISLDDDLVVEQDPEAAFPGGGGVRFVATARSHPITAGLVRSETQRDVPRVVVHFTRSMKKVSEPGSVSPHDLLVTSKDAFGLTSIAGAADWKDAPRKGAGDLGGPLVLGMAAERPKVSPSAAHGPRVVVLGTASPLTSASFREPLPVRGAALVVESAILWLASKPQVLDVPERRAVAAGMRITDESRAEIRRYVLVFMPAAVAVLGLAVAMFRRSREGARRTPPPNKGGAPPT